MIRPIHVDDIQVKQIPDEDPDPSYLDQAEFAERKAEYERGEFGFVGVRAEIEIKVGDVLQTITSGGLWGIEDDSGAEYFEEVGNEQVDELVDILKEMGVEVEGIENDDDDDNPEEDEGDDAEETLETA